VECADSRDGQICVRLAAQSCVRFSVTALRIIGAPSRLQVTDGGEGGRERVLSFMSGLWAQVRSESERRRLYTEIEHLSGLVDSYRRGGMHARR
jgi:hypothetical protein